MVRRHNRWRDRHDGRRNDPVARSIHTFSIPSSTRYLEDVRRFVETHALEANLPEQTVEQFKIAVDEACANVIEHAYQGQEDHRVDLAVIVEADRFTVRIRDRGVPFNLNTYREPNLMEMAKRRKAGGFGVHIMRRLMDRVEYRSRGQVNEVLLTKFRNANSPATNNQA